MKFDNGTDYQEGVSYHRFTFKGRTTKILFSLDQPKPLPDEIVELLVEAMIQQRIREVTGSGVYKFWRFLRGLWSR